MMTQIFILTGSFIILFLGGAHWWYTISSDKFFPRQADTLEKMKTDYPKLTRQTTIWNSSLGFHKSHSYGAMFIGAINILLVVENFSLFSSSYSLIILDCITVILYWWLAKKHWFKIPLIGLSISAISYLAAFALLLTKN